MLLRDNEPVQPGQVDAQGEAAVWRESSSASARAEALSAGVLLERGLEADRQQRRLEKKRAQQAIDGSYRWERRSQRANLIAAAFLAVGVGLLCFGLEVGKLPSIVAVGVGIVLPAVVYIATFAAVWLIAAHKSLLLHSAGVRQIDVRDPADPVPEAPREQSPATAHEVGADPLWAGATATAGERLDRGLEMDGKLREARRRAMQRRINEAHRLETRSRSACVWAGIGSVIVWITLLGAAEPYPYDNYRLVLLRMLGFFLTFVVGFTLPVAGCTALAARWWRKHLVRSAANQHLTVHDPGQIDYL